MKLKRMLALFLSLLPITAVSFAAKAYAKTGSSESVGKSGGNDGDHGGDSVSIS